MVSMKLNIALINSIASSVLVVTKYFVNFNAIDVFITSDFFISSFSSIFLLVKF